MAPGSAKKGTQRRTAGTPRNRTASTSIAQLPNPFVPDSMAAASENPKVLIVVRRFIDDTMSKGIGGIRREFALLKNNVDPAARVPLDAPGVAGKFRYKDVQCLERTRCVLSFLPSYGDFIHANWVKNDLLANRFICAQGPLESTSADFWRLTWQENVKNIFMLCRCEEMGKNKCFQYWPKREGDTMTFLGVLTVKNAGINETDPDLITTRISLTYKGETRLLEHKQWVTWPDKSVPKNPVPAFQLLNHSRVLNEPCLIHCSAGIGRTGTLVVLELIQRHLLSGIEVNVPAIVQDIRSQRCQAVQTEDQYVFCRFVLLNKLMFHSLMAESEYKIFATAYEEYIKIIGGVQTMQAIQPNRTNMSMMPSLSMEQAAGPTTEKRLPKKKPPTIKMRRKPSPKSNEETGVVNSIKKQAKAVKKQSQNKNPSKESIRKQKMTKALKSLKKKKPPSEGTTTTGPSTSRSEQQPLHSMIAGSCGASPSNCGRDESARKPGREESTRKPTREESTRKPMREDGARKTARDESARKPESLRKPESVRKHRASCESPGPALVPGKDEGPKSVFLQPNLAQECQKENFAASKPVPTAQTLMQRDEKSQYADTTSFPVKSPATSSSSSRPRVCHANTLGYRKKQ